MTRARRTTTQILRVRSVTPAGWLSGRVRNVLAQRAKLLACALGGAVGMAALLLNVTGAARPLTLSPPAPPVVRAVDTLPFVTAEGVARARLAEAQGLLDSLRARPAPPGPAPSVATPAAAPADRGRDSLVREIAALDALVQRAEAVPLAASYRALAARPSLRGDARVTALLDSLDDTEREREDFGGGADVDPVFVALTMRVHALGARLVSIARARRTVLQREATRTRAAARPSTRTTVPDVLPPTDTLPARQALDSAVTALALATARADSARQLARATPPAAPPAGATPPALARAPVVAAGVVLGTMAAFALLLLLEIRRPRIADAFEVERHAGARVLATIVPPPRSPERTRRAADRERPTALDAATDTYRILASHLAGQIVVVVGEPGLLRATTAANVAATLANDARNVLIVDVDFSRGALAPVLGIPNSPGVADVLENRKRWPETVRQVVTGRERSMDAISAGTRARHLGPSEAGALSAELERAARRYDITVVSAPAALAERVLGGHDAVLCAVARRTRHAQLKREADTVRAGGGRVVGVALRYDEIPRSR